MGKKYNPFIPSSLTSRDFISITEVLWLLHYLSSLKTGKYALKERGRRGCTCNFQPFLQISITRRRKTRYTKKIFRREIQQKKASGRRKGYKIKWEDVYVSSLNKEIFHQKSSLQTFERSNYSFESQSKFLTHNFLGTHILSHRREEKQTGKNSLSSSSSPYLIICVLHYRNTWEDKIKRTSEKREDQTKRSRRFYLSSHFD